MNSENLVRSHWDRDDPDAVALLSEIAQALDSTVKGERAYRYERAVTELYGLPLRPSDGLTVPTRWETPARLAMEQAVANDDVGVEFFAFAICATSLRRAGNYEDLRQLLADHEASLAGVPLFAHYRAMAEIAYGSNPRLAVALATDAVKQLGDHAGAYHSLALAILDLAESGADAAKDRALERARSAIARAIRLDPAHPRFRLTRARIDRLMGRLEEARDDIIAARNDDRGADHDPERRRLYEYELLLVNAAMELNRRVGAIEKRVDDRVRGVEVRAAEIAGFITGVVALTISGANLAMSRTDALSAVLVLAVVAALVFGGAIALGFVLGRTS